MPTSSLREAIIRLDTSQWSVDDPLDTAMAATVLQNLAHLADSAGQVLVAYPPAALGNGLVRSLLTNLSPTRTIATFGPFPIRIRTDGSSYPVRVRLAGRVTTGTADISVSIHSPSVDPITLHGSTTDGRVERFSVSSTVVAWQTPTVDNLIGADAADMPNHEASQATRSSIGGDSTAVAVQMAMISVTGIGDVALDFELSGLYAAEFIGL